MYNGDPEEEEETKKEPPVYPSEKDSKDIPLVEIPSSSAGSSTRVDKTGTRDSTVPLMKKASNEPLRHFHDGELSRDLREAVHTDPNTPNAAHARQLNGFFTVLALCHTVLTNIDPVTRKIEYRAQSPDEAALVQAAADMGFIFRGRDKEVLLLQTPFSHMGVGEEDASASGSDIDKDSQHGDGLERYELLNILEFTSTRKRMSVVLRKLDDDGRIFLLSKGADNVIFERLKPGSGEELRATTEKHLDEFANQGLRTLTMAYKVIGGR